jgi:hypothetical protein
MTMQELEQAEKTMQRQWHDLVLAEQEAAALETLEQMYDRYILLAEEYNRCSEEYHREQQRAYGGRGPIIAGGKRQSFSGRAKGRDDIKLAS